MAEGEKKYGAFYCPACGKKLETEGAAFCPFCGVSLGTGTESAETSGSNGLSEKARTLLDRAARAESLPEKNKWLLKAREDSPGCFPVEWELLFIGHEKPVRGRMDFGIIKSYLLKMYISPQEFSDSRKQQDREELFGDPQLLKCMALSPEPEDATLWKYLLRLCAEFIDLFLAGDNQINKTIFGFHLDRNPEKTLSRAAADVMRNILADDKMPKEKRTLLYRAFYQAMNDRLKGNTQWLDELL